MAQTKQEAEKQFNIKEYAIGNVNKRNKFTDNIAEIIKKNNTNQLYQSYFNHSIELEEHWKTHKNEKGQNSVEGYNGSVAITDVIIDVDIAKGETDLNISHTKAKEILNRLEKEYGVKLIYIYPNFSGAKGFHIRIPSELFGGFEPSNQLPDIIKTICLEIAGDVKIDKSVYKTTGLMRVPNTLNLASKLYAIPLAAVEITNLSIDTILKKAEKQTDDHIRVNNPKPYPKLVELKNSVIEKLSSEAKMNAKKQNAKDDDTEERLVFRLNDEVKLSDGTNATIKEIDKKTSIFCPFCDHSKRSHPNNANAFIDMNNEGYYYIYCSSEAKTFWQKTFKGGGIFTKDTNEYFKIKRNGKEFVEVRLTSFIIEPKELLDLQDSDTLKCDVKTVGGKTYTNVLLENKDWHSKSKLLSAIGHQDCVFLGSDNEVQMLCDVINKKTPVRKTGSKIIGLHNDKWVIENRNITANGELSPPIIIPSEKGAESFHKKIEYLHITKDESQQLINGFYENILNINRIETILPFVAWGFITPIKSKILEFMDGFPHLFVHGAQGSGKTSTALMMMRLWGYKSSGTFSCTLNPFPMLKFMSSTNAVPLVFDEFKKQDLTQFQVDNIHRMMRKSYSNEIESRGKPDQTTVDYHLTAPMAVMGEWNTTQPAIRERIIVSSFNNIVKENHDMQNAFHNLKQLKLEGFMNNYIPFILGQDVKILLDESKNEVDNKFQGYTIAPRVKNNLSIMYGGFLLFKRFAEANNITFPTVDMDKVLEFQLAEITGSNTGQVESAVDQLITGISTMLSTRLDFLKSDDHFIIHNDGILAIHFSAMLPNFKEWVKRTDYEIDILDPKSYMKLFKDTPYITETSKNTRYGMKGLKRSIWIDIDKAQKTGVVLEGFGIEEKPTAEELGLI